MSSSIVKGTIILGTTNQIKLQHAIYSRYVLIAKMLKYEKMAWLKVNEVLLSLLEGRSLPALCTNPSPGLE